MVENPYVSIICTVYNKGPWIAQAIESFLAQKVDFPYEILLIDDASTDNSRQVIEKYTEAFPEVIKSFYNPSNLGISKTWVKVCKEARGQWIARCDGDDFWIDNEKIKKQLDALEVHPNSLWCSCDFDIYDENGNLTQKSGFENHIIPLANTYEKMLATRGFTMSSTWLVDRNLMLKVNEQLDLTTSDDTFNIQLDLFQETQLTYLPEAMVAYRINQGSDSRPKDAASQHKRFDKLLETQLLYLDKYPKSNYKKMLQILLDRHNTFEKELSQRDFIHSKVNSQKVTIYYATENESFSQNKVLEFQLQYQDRISFAIPNDTNTLRIDLSEFSSFYQKVSLVVNEFETELLPNFTNGRIIGNYVMFNDNDPQLIYDVSSIKEKSFTLTYAMFNVDKIDDDDYIAKILSCDLLDYRNQVRDLISYKIQFEQADEERKRYKQELEDMVVRYNSVTHSRRWTIPTAIINFFRRRK